MSIPAARCGAGRLCAAPLGPDWSWRITVEADGASRFQLIMHNITPEGQDALAVLASFERQTETIRR